MASESLLDDDGDSWDRTRVASRPKPMVSPAPCLGRLRIVSCPDERLNGASFELRGADVILGRSGDATICLNDEDCSRVHARVVRTGTDNVLLDMESTNGSFVNGARVTEAVLRRGDKILLGSTAIAYEPA